MADSAAVRQARRRRHRMGDHSMCTRRCGDSRALAAVAELPAGSAEKLDPVAGLTDLAGRLAAAYAADPANTGLARELRMTLLVLPGAGDAGAEREWQAFVDSLSIPVVVDDEC